MGAANCLGFQIGFVFLVGAGENFKKWPALRPDRLRGHRLHSLQSIWCKYELNYFSELGRKIYVINAQDIISGNFNVKLLEDAWFIDPNYKEMALLEGEKIPEMNESL